MQQSNQISSKAFYRTVATLVVPMALQNLINVGVQSADVVMLGRVDEVVLSAASLAGQVQFIMVLLFFGLASGASVLTAQYWGKGDTRTIEKVIAITLRLAVGVAVIFSMLAFFVPEAIMRIFSPEADIIREGARYLRVVAPSYLFMAFTNTYLSVMRSVERVIISTVVYFISFCSNIVLNSIFIFGLFGFPRLEIVGAGLGTTISRLLELVIVLVYALHNPVVRLRRKDFIKTNKVLFKDFMHYSLPTTLNEIFWGVGIATNSVIIGHMGAQVVAANSVANVVRQLAAVVCFGIANAAAIMLGKAIGAGEPEKAKEYGSRFVKLTLGMAAIASLVVLIIRPFVVSAMKLSPDAERYLQQLLLMISVYIIMQAYNTTMIVGIFRGGGDTRFGLVLDIFSMWTGSILFSALAAFVFHFPPEIVFFFIMSDELIKIPFVTLRYKSRRWLRNVTR